MAAIVSLRDVIDEMELASDEASAYINRQTGELITIAHEMFALIDDPEQARGHARVVKIVVTQSPRGRGVG